MRLLLPSFSLIFIVSFLSCTKADSDGRFHVVTTTTMLTDLVQNIGGDSILLTGLMHPGIDPHSYKPPESSVMTLGASDLILYQGLHLEGRMNFVFEKMQQNSKYRAFAVAEALAKEKLLTSEYFPGMYDPHIWFSIDLWKDMAVEVERILSSEKPDSKIYFNENKKRYLRQLDDLQQWSEKQMQTLPPEKRYLVTAHDAFGYFGREWQMQVIGIQGISTNSEAGFGNLLQLASLIQEKQIPVVFTETSVSDKSVRALQQAVRNSGGNLQIGQALYSDALGSKSNGTETYIGMYKYNMQTIVNELQ